MRRNSVSRQLAFVVIIKFYLGDAGHCGDPSVVYTSVYIEYTERGIVSDLEDQPHIGSFIQADFAEAVNGKLYLMGGGFDTVWAPHFPWDVRFFFGAIVFVPWKDTNRRLPVEGRVVSSDGEDLGWNLDGELEAGRAPGQRGGRSSLVIAGPVAFRVE